MTDSPTSGTRSSRTTTRDRLLQAGARLLISRGYDDVSLDAIGAAAMVTPADVTATFIDRDDLYLSLIRELGAAQLRALTDPAVVGETFADRTLGHLPWVATTEELRTLRQALWMLAPRNDPLRWSLHAIQHRVLTTVSTNRHDPVEPETLDALVTTMTLP